VLKDLRRLCLDWSRLSHKKGANPGHYGGINPFKSSVPGAGIECALGAQARWRACFTRLWRAAHFVQDHRATFGLVLILRIFLAYELICDPENIQYVR